MSLAMDGVRPNTIKSRPVGRPKKTPVVQTLPVQPRRFVVGMDGIRRPAPLSPRELLVNMQEPEVPAVVAATVAPALTMPSWQLPSLRLPEIGWKRPAMAFGLVATAVIAAGWTAHALATPRTITARAEGTVAAQPAPTPAKAAVVVPKTTGVQTILDNFVAAHGDSFGIVVKNLKTGETAMINPDRQMTSASLYKLFVAQRIYQRVDIGQLSYGSPAGGGTGRNVEQCLRVMINISDNACGRALGAMLGWDHQDPALKLEGYKQTTLASPQQTSAGDVAKMYDRLYEGTLVSPNSSQRFMDLLKDQRVNNRLPQGLPAGTVIAHKTGDLDGVVHDAGIVYGPKADYLVVMTSGPWKFPGNAAPMFADLSRQLWNHFEQ